MTETLPLREASSRRSQPIPARLSCAVVRSARDLGNLVTEWLDLYHEIGTPNPFAHPVWVTTWLKHYTSPEQLYVVTIRQADRLVGIAPFYRRRRVRWVRPGVSLELAGANSKERLTEAPEILLAGGSARTAFRELVRFLVEEGSRDWHWAEVTLGPTQGWFEPEWIPAWAQTRGSACMHKVSRAFVILDLPPHWHLLRSGLKRNMKEAIRRSANRLARAEGGWEYRVVESPAHSRAAIDTLLKLHRLRAGTIEKKRHADCFADPRDEAFMRDAVAAMVEAGCARVAFLRIGDVDVAGRLVLNTNSATFFSFSGLDPTYWRYGPGTALMVESLRGAIERGDHVANLSQHPEDSKLRWSERLEVHNEFLLVAPRRAARASFSLYLALRALREGYTLLRNR